MSTAERLRAFRRARRVAGQQLGASELAYAVYVGVLVSMIVGFPLLRAVVLELAEPRLSQVVSSPLLLPAVLAGLGLLAVAAGPVFGPATVRAFDWSVLGSGDIPYRQSLAGPVLRSSAALIAGALALCAVLFGAAALSGDDPGILVQALLVTALAAPSLAALWLAAQVLGARAGTLAVVVVALCGIAVTLPAAGAIGILGVAALCALGAIPWLLERMPGTAVATQALRVDGALTSAVGGDPGLALETLRTRPAVGRRWRAVRPGNPVTMYLRRGAIGAARTPLRLMVGVLSTVVAGILLGAAVHTPGMLGAAIAGAAVLLAYLGLGTASDGLRHAGMAAVTPAIYGGSPVAALAWHALFPLAVLALALLPGAMVTGAGVLGLSLVPVILGLRLIDATEPPMDPAVLAPIPTPVGDLSGLTVFFWLTGTATLAVATAALAVWLSAPAIGALGALGCAIVVLRRVRAGSTA